MHLLQALLLLCALVSTPVFAHGDDHDHDSPLNTMSRPEGLGSASMALLQRDIKLFDGYGQGMFFLNPANDEEKYINQGYASLNVFHYADAYRSFRMATKINEESVQGYVGVIFSIADQDSSPEAQNLVIDILNHLEDINTMFGWTQKETAWINFAKAVYLERMGGTKAGLKNTSSISLNQAYQNLATTDGNNVEFRAYINWSIFSGYTANYVKQQQERVLADYPNHVGAAHYLLHIAEMENNKVAAKEYGEILAPLALGSAHAQHMLGHALPQFGLWQEALDLFLAADKIHHDWAAENEVELHEDWHYAHNLDLMAAAYLGLGNDREAFNKWLVAMPYDFRAVPKAIGVLLATDRLQEADQLISQLEQNGPQWVNFLANFRYELNILMDPATAKKKVMPQPGSYDYLVESLRNYGTNKINDSRLVNDAKAYFTRRLTSGGFDGWSNSFVELLRLKNLAAKLNAPTVELELDVLIEASRKGTL